MYIYIYIYYSPRYTSLVSFKGPSSNQAVETKESPPPRKTRKRKSPRLLRIALVLLLHHLRLLQNLLQPLLQLGQLRLLDHQRLLIEVLDDERVVEVFVDLEDYGFDGRVAVGFCGQLCAREGEGREREGGRGGRHTIRREYLSTGNVSRAQEEYLDIEREREREGGGEQTLNGARHGGQVRSSDSRVWR